MKKAEGFTLVELMIVIAVIAILATMGLLGFARAQKAGRDTARGQIMKGVQIGLECVYGRDGAYPAAMAAWNNPAGDFGADCWDAGVIKDPWKNTTLDPAGTVTGLTGVSYAYSSPGDNTSYALILSGESGRTYTFESPK